MTLLRGALSAGAALLLALSAPLVVIPRTIVETILGQGPGDDIWIRLFGTAGVALALFHVLILRKLDDLWWWCWAFVLFDASVAAISLTHAAVGLPEDSAAWPWWLLGTTAVGFSALYLVGLAKAGREQPFA